MSGWDESSSPSSSSMSAPDTELVGRRQPEAVGIGGFAGSLAGQGMSREPGQPRLIAKCDYDFSAASPMADKPSMRVISKSRLKSFWESHKNRADAEKAFTVWYKIASKVEWENFAGLRQTFGSADQVGNCVVFDVGNNRYRLIGRVFYPRLIYVLRVMDHKEYDETPWAKQCGCHQPPPKKPGTVRKVVRKTWPTSKPRRRRR